MLSGTLGVLRQYGAAISAALSVFIIGNWIAWPSAAVKDLLDGKTKLNVTKDEISWAVALLDVGNFISPVPSSYVSDCLGRKLSLLILSFFLFGSWLLVILGTHVYYLHAARLIAGLCKGFIFTIVPIYLAEIAGTNVRGAVGTIFCSMLNYGILFELFIGPLMSYNSLNIIASPFPLLLFILLIQFPESPHFLLMKGRARDAQRSLSWLRNLDESSPSLEQELKGISANVEKDMKKGGSFKDLVSTPEARQAVIIAMGFAIFQRLSGISSIIAYSTVTLPPTGGYFSPEVYMIFFAIATIIGQSLCATLIDRFGRRPLMIISCIGCSITTGISGFFYWIDDFYNVTPYNWVPYVCLIGYGFKFAIGIGTIPSILVSELFSIDIRSYAASTAAMCYAISSFFANKVYFHVQSTIGIHYMYLFFTLSDVFCIVFTCVMLFETKGKTFTEIQDTLKRKSVHRINPAEQNATEIKL